MLPLISIITPTFNNEKDLPNFLYSIKNQNYPQQKKELIIVDGGSTDRTVFIAKKNGCITLHNPQRLAEPGVSLGMTHAKGSIIIILATDNLYKDTQAFKKIAYIFNNKHIYGAFPKQDYDTTDNIFTRYHNTFTDPFNHFVYGEASNARTFHRIYKTLIHNGVYDVYDFASSPVLPMISFSQGFAIRGGYRRKKEDFLDDCGPVIDLIENKKQIAFIHSLSLYHHTINDMSHFIKKQRWATQNALSGKKYGIAHRYQKLSMGQRIRMFLWPFYAFSFIFPFIDGVIGYVKDRELLWFFHPVNCFLCGYANLYQLSVYIIGKIKSQSTVAISRQ